MERKRLSLALAKGESVSAVLTLPPGNMPHSVPGIITAHGAGHGMENPLLVAFADGLAGAGYPALRFNFPYMEQGHNAPDPPGKLEETLMAAYRYFREGAGLDLTKIIAAGKSMGGRAALLMAAAGRLPVGGLIFLGYPLHHAADTTSTMDALRQIKVPMLFLAGTRDPFCDLELLKSVLSRSPVSWEIDAIEDGDHCLNLPGSMGIGQSGIFERIVKTTVQWLKEEFI